MGPYGVGKPRPRDSNQRITPSAAASPKALPPVSSTASTRSTVFSGAKRALSRDPGALPRTRPEARQPPSGQSTTVHPVLASDAVQWPTVRPATAVNVRFMGSEAGTVRSRPG